MLTKIRKLNLHKIKEKKNKTQNKKINEKTIIILSIIIVILFGVLVGTSFSRYQSIITGKIIAQIAKPVLEVRREESILVTANNPKASYSFEVRNYKEKDLNEVEMEYYIEIVSGVGEEIQFKLYKGESQIELTNNRTPNITLAKGEKQTHTYRLDITYDKSKVNEDKPINENVEIKIHSIQKA